MKLFVIGMFLIGVGFALPNGWVVMAGGLIVASWIILRMERVSQ